MNCTNHPDRERTAFCQNCGKPLCQECTRTVGSAVFCEPCLAAKLAGAGTPTEASSTGTYTYSYTYPNAATYGVRHPSPAAQRRTQPRPRRSPRLHPRRGSHVQRPVRQGNRPSRRLRHSRQPRRSKRNLRLFIARLGLLPGHRSAPYRPGPARRHSPSQPLWPERSWRTPRLRQSLAQQQCADSSGHAHRPRRLPHHQPEPTLLPRPTIRLRRRARAPSWESYVPPTPPVSAYGAIPATDPNSPYLRNRFPAGAIWLIGLGLIFLIGNTGFFHGFPIHRLIPFFLIGLGVWLFVHKMTISGATLADDGTAYYRIRLFGALRGSVWIILVGVLFLLSTFNILSWGRSWPLFIIVAGLMTFFERTAYSSAATPVYPAPPAAPPPRDPLPPP